MPEIPNYIELRIRQAPPTDLFVVESSTPVVSFGNARSAFVATLGLNPSRREFCNAVGTLLGGGERRLATHESLGTSDLVNAPQEIIDRVLDDCDRYFDSDRNPYWSWFARLEPLLNSCGASYRNGSACHLDLVQWATDPTWGKLPSSARNRLLEADRMFLCDQLQNEKIRIVLINGMGAYRKFESIFDHEVEEVSPITGLSFQKTRLFFGRLFGRIRIVAWSTNLQSSRGVTNRLRDELAVRVKELVS